MVESYRNWPGTSEESGLEDLPSQFKTFRASPGGIPAAPSSFFLSLSGCNNLLQLCECGHALQLPLPFGLIILLVESKMNWNWNWNWNCCNFARSCEGW